MPNKMAANPQLMRALPGCFKRRRTTHDYIIIGVQHKVAVEALESFAQSGIAYMNGIEVGINE